VEGRLEKFKELLKLIRFPLMRAREFAEIVVPTAVLSDKDGLEILVYILLQKG
jgi:hypothetical protein